MMSAPQAFWISQVCTLVKADVCFLQPLLSMRSNVLLVDHSGQIGNKSGFQR